jgi:outer membrane protein OmpU
MRNLKMKKLLLASTALVATAGMAAADVTVSGHAAAGYHSDLDAAGSTASSATDTGIYSNVGVDFAMAGATDNGLTFGATLNIDAGTEIDQGNFEFDGNDGGTAGLGSVTVSGAFGTLTFDNNGIDNLYNADHDDHDVKFAGTVNGIAVAITADADDSVDGTTGDATDADMSASASYTSGAMTYALAVSNHEADGMATNLKVTYVVNDMLTVSASNDTESTAGSDAVTKVAATIVTNGLTIGLSSDNSASGGDWDVDLGYSLSGVALAYGTDENDAWAATASKSLGGGATAQAGINWEDSVYAGISFAF